MKTSISSGRTSQSQEDLSSEDLKLVDFQLEEVLSQEIPMLRNKSILHMQGECYRIQLQLDLKVETIHWQDCKVALLLKWKIHQ